MKIVKLEIQLLTYGLVLSGISIGLNTFSLRIALNSVFPILSYHWWYPVSYFILLLISPYLFDFLEQLDKKKHTELIVVSVCAIQIYLKCNPFIGAEVFLGHESHGLIWWIELFIIGNYLSKYGEQIKTKHATISFLISISFLILYRVLPSIKHKVGSIFTISYVSSMLGAFHRNGFFSLIATVSLFMMLSTVRLRITSTKLRWFIKKTVPAIFGVYLIQEHNGIRMWLWNTVSIENYKGLAIPIVITVVFCILLLCSIVINELNIRITKKFETMWTKRLTKKLPSNKQHCH